MNVLLLSLDNKTFLGDQDTFDTRVYSGDTIERHKKYGELVSRLYIVVTSPPGYTKATFSKKVTIYPTNSRSFFGHGLRALRYASRFHEREKLTLVVAQDLTAPAAWLIKKKLHIPYVVSFHAADFSTPEWKQKISNRILLPIIKFSVKKADGLRVVSPEMKIYFERLGVTCPIVVIPTPTNIEIFTHKNDKQVNQIKEMYRNKRIILTDGRLEPVKNYPLLFKVFKRLQENTNDIVLLVIGSGSQKEQLKKIVHTSGLKNSLFFLGSMPYEALPPYYQAADIFLLTSDSESLGKVLMQAGAAGTPVVATATHGAKSIIVHGKTGFLADIGSNEQLANYAERLLCDSVLRENIGTQAQQHILTHFNSEENIQKLVNFWKSVVRL